MNTRWVVRLLAVALGAVTILFVESHAAAFVAGGLAALLWVAAEPGRLGSSAARGEGEATAPPRAGTMLGSVALRFAPLLLVGGFWALTRGAYLLGGVLLAAFAVVQVVRGRAHREA